VRFNAKRDAASIVELYVVTGKASLSTTGRLSVTATYAMQQRQ